MWLKHVIFVFVWLCRICSYLVNDIFYRLNQVVLTFTNYCLHFRKVWPKNVNIVSRYFAMRMANHVAHCFLVGALPSIRWGHYLGVHPFNCFALYVTCPVWEDVLIKISVTKNETQTSWFAVNEVFITIQASLQLSSCLRHGDSCTHTTPFARTLPQLGNTLQLL